MAANVALPDGTPISPAAEPNCPICATSGRRWAVKNHHSLWKCASCGAIFCDVVESPKPLYDRLYADSKFAAPEYVLDALRRVVRGAAPFKQTGRWLDVGYGEGFLLSVAEQAGWAPFGIEVSSPVLEYGRRRGWVVAENAAADPRFPKRGFDVVTLIETLEHAPAPMDLLAAAAEWVRPGGLLYLTTPNARSANRWFLGSAWTVFDPPDHRTLWTRTAIGRSLRQAGFRAATIQTHGLNPAEIVARVRGRRGAAVVDGGSRNRTAQALGEMLAASPRRRALKGAANAALNWLGAGDTIKAWAVREA